jgi:hypothetical protein
MKRYLIILALCGSVQAGDYYSFEQYNARLVIEQQREIAERQAEIEEQLEKIAREQARQESLRLQAQLAETVRKYVEGER